MVGKIDYSSVPTSADLENNSNQKKYTINHPSSKKLVISRSLCTLMAIGALLLAVLVGLVVFFLVPRTCNGLCENAPLASLVQKNGGEENLEEVSERLPRDVRPLLYTIELWPYFENSTTKGREIITLQTDHDTNSITLHLKNIEVDKYGVLLASATNSSDEIQITAQQYLDGEKYKISLAEDMKKGQNYTLSLNFQGQLSSQLQGFYKSEYEDGSGVKRFAATQFSPTDARRAFPCFDDPSFKARFKLRIGRPANLSTLSNMPLDSSDLVQTADGEGYWDNYPETPQMSTYLVAFLVSDLIPVETGDDLIKIWARRKYLSQTEYAAKVAPKVLRYFENYFRIPFPLKKIDIVAVPEFGFNAMENWGLITFRESALLFDNYSSSVMDQNTIAVVLSHEIAHQWFGNLVTPKWWNDLWLKEGFATYLEYLGVDNAEPSWKILEEFLPNEIERAMALDSLESSRPISFDVVNSAQIRQTFDEISYAKGACIIRMMNHYLGEETFKNGLIKYLNKFQYGNADRNDLFQSLTEEAHLRGALHQNESVKNIMDTWTEQAGFPVVNVVADKNNNTLRLVQKRFFTATPASKNDQTWWIPISFTTSYSRDLDTIPKFWIRGEVEVFQPISSFGQWYLINLNQTGYYIVNYDEENWRNLMAHIMDVPPIIRAQLISDSMDLARANQLDYDIPLRLISRMAVQDFNIMFVPHLVAFRKLKFLSDILYDTPAYGLFEEYHKAIFSETYNMVNFEDSVDDYLTRRIRATVLEWACKSSGSRCSYTAMKLFRDLTTSSGRAISPNLRSVVYCTAIREGTSDDWDFAYDMYTKTASPTEKSILLNALGCTKLKWLLSRYLDKLIDGYSIRIQDADSVFESVAENREGLLVAFNFIRKNWNDMLSHYGDGFNILAKMVKSLAVHMKTEFQLDELIRFRDSIKPNISTTSQAFDVAIERVRGNVEWMKKNYHQVEHWLQTHKNQFNFI